MSSKLVIVILLLITNALAFRSAAKEKDEANDEAAKAAQIGDEVAMQLFKRLGGELKQALQSGGIAEAIGVCAGKAQDMTKALAADRPEVVEIKRISSRFRNPLNRPDDQDRNVLQHFESAKEKGDPLPEGKTLLHEKDGKSYFVHYKPIVVQSLCVMCHGSSAHLSPATAKVLKEHYPEDRATGYQPGDFRGLFKVTMPAEAVRKAMRSER